MPKPTFEELEETLTKPSFEDLEDSLGLRATAVLDPNEEIKKFEQAIDMADVNEVPLDVAEQGLDDFVKIKKKKDAVGIGPLWDEPSDVRTMRERLNLPPHKKIYTINLGAMTVEIPKGLARFLQRDIGGTFGGTVYNWLGQLIQQGGYAVDQISKLGMKDKDRIYNPIAESIITAGQNISQSGIEAREWYAYQAATGWEAMDEHLRKTDPISYGAGRLTEGVASSALSVLTMYLSGGAAAPELLNKGLQINRGLVALSMISAGGAFEHAQNQGENFYWATLHGLADGMTEYVMESTFLEGVGKGTGKLVAGAKEGAEEFFTGMLQNTRAGILENEAKGMSAYDASKKAIKAALVQSPWEVAAGFIGGWGVAGGAQLTELYQRSKVPIGPVKVAEKPPSKPVEPRKPAKTVKPPAGAERIEKLQKWYKDHNAALEESPVHVLKKGETPISAEERKTLQNLGYSIRGIAALRPDEARTLLSKAPEAKPPAVAEKAEVPKVVQKGIERIQRLDVKQRKLEWEAEQIAKTAPVNQAPPIYHRTLDKVMELQKQKAVIWNKIRDIIVTPDGKTLWQIMSAKYPMAMWGKEEHLNIYAENIEEALAKPEALKEKPKVEPKYKAHPGFVDLTPLAEAGEQIKTTTEKAAKVTTRFGGLESEVQKVLIEYEEQVRELPKVIAKDAIDKFGELTTKQERAIENHRENPKKYPDLPDELKGPLQELEKGIEEYGKRLEELGYPADWPNTYSKRLEKMLQREQAKAEPNPEKIENIEKALKEAKDLQYLHHYYQKTSVGKRIWARFRRRISKRPTGVLGRKIPTYEKAEEVGLKRAPLAVSYAHMAHEIARAEIANDLITAINSNPNLSLSEDQAPDEWVRLDERIFPASVQHQVWAEEGKPRHKRAYRKYPIPIAEALEEITYSRGNEMIERAYDKLNFGLKIIGFYNPLVMTKNDAVQIWRATGVKGFMPLVLPQIEFQNISIKPPRAVQIWMEKGPEYQKLRKGGLFNNIVNYTPAVTEITEQMLNHIRETSGEKAVRIIGETLNPINLAKNMRRYNDMSTWNMDEIMRIACYETVKDTPLLRGMTDFEKIEWVNDALVNYGKMPKSTKRWVGKAMFVPTYRVGNFRFFWNEVSRVYQGQWRHIAPITRTVAYKMFVRWGLPATIAAAIFWKTGKERDVYTEKGYRLVIHNPETNTDTIYALSDPLLEGAKLTQRTLRHTLQLNLAPLPALLYRALKGPQYKQADDPFGEFFKLGTPVYRDILNWKDPDKTVPQKILTQFAIAYVYSRRGREQDREHVILAIAKALSIWTDWKEQKADIFNMMTGRSFYSGPGGEFGRLLRKYSVEQDIDRAEIDKKIDSLIMKGENEKAIRMMLETGRYQTTEGVSGRLMQHKNPILYYWVTMPNKERAGFLKWLKNTRGYNQKEIDELTSSLEKSKP